MEITHSKKDGFVVVEVLEEIDLFHSARFKGYFDKLDDSVTRIIVDFQGVTYIDSSGIGALLSIYKTIKQKNSKIMFLNIKGPVKKVIELTKLDDYLPICQTMEEAIGKLRA